jgi:acetyl-CoA C-acetyltransferase
MTVSTNLDPIVIVGAKRTPMGGLQGALASKAAHELGSIAIRAAVAEAGIDGNDVDGIIMGNVLPAGQGQAPARQASRNAGLPDAAGAVTINKICGSGLKAVMDAHDQIVAGSADVMVAGGMESMTNAPYLLQKARGGFRMGHGEIKDSMFLDGLEDAYDKGKAMGVFADATAQHYQFTREAQDAFAVQSTTRAKAAIAAGAFKKEIAAVETKDGLIDTDEAPGKVKLDKIPTLKPAFVKDGTVTAGSSSSISDGAAAFVMMRESTAKAKGLKPLAFVRGHASHAQEPQWFTTAPVGAMNTLLKKVGWAAKEVDLYEINEAFACVTMAAIHDLGLDGEKVNVNGGACALGHPIGASGARILVTLLHALEARNLKTGVASLCIGGGEAVAVAIERA